MLNLFSKRPSLLSSYKVCVGELHSLCSTDHLEILNLYIKTAGGTFIIMSSASLLHTHCNFTTLTGGRRRHGNEGIWVPGVIQNGPPTLKNTGLQF